MQLHRGNDFKKQDIIVHIYDIYKDQNIFHMVLSYIFSADAFYSAYSPHPYTPCNIIKICRSGEGQSCEEISSYTDLGPGSWT